MWYKLLRGNLIDGDETYYNDKVAFVIKSYGVDGYKIVGYEKVNGNWENRKIVFEQNRTCENCKHQFMCNKQVNILVDVKEYAEEKLSYCSAHEPK
jgi:hypothetical protein